MLKKLIVIEDDEEFQCDNIRELVKKIVDKNYYNYTEEEKYNKLNMLALANSLGNDDKFLTRNEITYILSLLMANKIVLLENKNADIFTKYIDKSNIKNNYIIVNKFAKEILQKYVNK